MREVRRPQGPHRRLLHLPRLRRQLRLRLIAARIRVAPGGGETAGRGAKRAVTER
jgi:hypothetical protein